MPQKQNKIDADAAADFLESDDFKKLSKSDQTDVLNYLKSNIGPTVSPAPNVSQDVLRRREQVGGAFPVPSGQQESIPARILSGAGKAVKGMAIDFPEHVVEAATAEPTEEEKARAKRHPKLFAEPKQGVGLTADRLLLDPQLMELHKSEKAGKEGRYSEAFGHGLASVLPGAGPMAAYFGEKIGRGEGWEALGEGGVYALANAATRGLTRQPTSSQRLAAASGEGARDFAVTIGDINKAAKKFGTPKTVGDLEDLTINTSKELENEFNIKLQPIAGQQLIPQEVAQALLSRANSSHLLKTPEGRATRAFLRQKAIDYQRPWTLGELNKQRMDMYSNRVSQKSGVGQMQAMKSSDQVLADKIIEDNLKEIVYDKMGRYYGKDAYFAKLKRRQSSLLNIIDNLHDRVDKLADSQADFEAAPFTKKIGMSVSAHAGGATPRAHGFTSLLAGGPEKIANKQVERAFPPSLTKSPSRAARYAIRQSIRHFPIASLYEQTTKDQKEEPQKELTPLK